MGVILATLVKLDHIPLVVSGIGRDTALFQKSPQHTQKVNFRLALQHYHARSDAPPTQQVEWRVQSQHFPTWTLLLRVGGPFVEDVPALPVENMFLPPPSPITSNNHDLERLAIDQTS